MQWVRPTVYSVEFLLTISRLEIKPDASIPSEEDWRTHATHQTGSAEVALDHYMSIEAMLKVTACSILQYHCFKRDNRYGTALLIVEECQGHIQS